MLHYDFEESVGYWAVVTAHAFHKALNEELAQHGITYRQWQVLAWLVLDGPLSQAELADRMDIEPATIVTVLARMQRDGLIRRESCALDRRKKIVCPTAAAEPIWAQGVECARRVRAIATAGFTPEQTAEARRYLAAMQENLRRASLSRSEQSTTHETISHTN